MRIGYPCINRSIGCRSNQRFRLASYSEERFRSMVTNNISCLRQILEWNWGYNILFFRIASDLIPFASHPICSVPWQEEFQDELAMIGDAITSSGMRISMHPDQFIVINSPDPKVVERSVAELSYHADLLDLMKLDETAKIQLHVGGRYNNPAESLSRFVRNYERLEPRIKRRLVIENDDQRFCVSDCLSIHEETGMPVLFDVFHHACHNLGEKLPDIIPQVEKTWTRSDGIMMVDYSSQNPEKRRGSHAEQIDTPDFIRFLEVSLPHDMDIMLEIKDKETSALTAISLARSDPRFITSGRLKNLGIRSM